MEPRKAFCQHKTNGVHLRFPNGNTLSTIWGAGTYTENNNWTKPGIDIIEVYRTVIPEGSDNVEVLPGCSDTVKALLDAKFPEESNGSVFGHMTFEKWLEMVNILNTHK